MVRRRQELQRRSAALGFAEVELFERLRELRAKIAREENIPSYIIFSDKTLTEMSVKLPADKAEMLKITGVGENKFEKYGRRFLDEIADYQSESRKTR